MRTRRASAIVAGVGAAAAVTWALGASVPATWTAQIAPAEAADGSTGVPDGYAPDTQIGVGAGAGEANAAVSDQAAKPTPTPTPAAPRPVEAVAVTNGSRAVAKVALTFDADLSHYTLNRIYKGTMPDQYNVAVVDYLESTGTPATMFVTGLWAERYPLAMQRFATNDIFEIGNHTYSHEAWTPNCYRLTYITDVDAQRAQLSATNSVIAAHTGEQPRFFRFPGLCHTSDDVALVASMGLVPVDTDIEGSDAFAQNPYAVAQSIAAQAQPGSVILLHLNGAPNAPATLQIVQQLLPMLQERGLAPVTLGELLGS